MTDSDRRIRSIVIVGGGSAGWMAAAALSNTLTKGCAITLVESEEIGTVGVGEATIPTIKLFNQTLGIDEAEFMKATQGSFKLGIQFVDWARLGHRYFHPFGTFGRTFDISDIHQHWIAAGGPDSGFDLDDLCMAWAAAKENRFSPPTRDPRSVLSTHDYAYHFDAGLYAAFLRKYSEARGVRRIEGKVASVQQEGTSGFVESVTMESGAVLAADLFIDCSGFRGLLIEGTLEDRLRGLVALAAMRPRARRALRQQRRLHALHPLNRARGRLAVAHPAATPHRQWLCLLLGPHIRRRGRRDLAGQSRRRGTGRSPPAALRDRPAQGQLEQERDRGRPRQRVPRTARIDQPPPRHGEYRQDHRLLPGPAISTRLVTEEFNRVSVNENERIRDFIILHYKLTQRDDSELWRYCEAMSIPDTLQFKIDHFRKFGRVIARENDLFGPPSWTAVHIGQFNYPERADPVLGYRTADSRDWLTKLRAAMAANAAGLPSHAEFIARHCKAPV